jgi:hypothetical protein
MRTNQKGKTIMLYNDTLKKMIIALAKKKNTTTTKYIEIALQNQINQDKHLLTQEDLLQIIDK